jgi:photosystem II protein
MNAHIEFFEGVSEQTLPIIQLTKSKTGKTGTATFIFIKPNFFKGFFYSSSSSFISKMTLKWENKVIVTKDLKIFFKYGKPFCLKAIFIFKNSQEWFNFLNFMTAYSKESGLFFSEND